MWLYRSSRSPLSTRKGWTENERLLCKREVCDALKHTGFSNVISKGISGVTYKYIGTVVGMKILKIYTSSICVSSGWALLRVLARS